MPKPDKSESQRRNEPKKKRQPRLIEQNGNTKICLSGARAQRPPKVSPLSKQLADAHEATIRDVVEQALLQRESAAKVDASTDLQIDQLCVQEVPNDVTAEPTLSQIMKILTDVLGELDTIKAQNEKLQKENEELRAFVIAVAQGQTEMQAQILLAIEGYNQAQQVKRTLIDQTAGGAAGNCSSNRLLMQASREFMQVAPQDDPGPCIVQSPKKRTAVTDLDEVLELVRQSNTESLF